MVNHKILNQKFLGNTSCLGDILTLSGYKNYFFVPCHAYFASMDNFYKTHGNHTIYALDFWKSKHPKTAFKSWAKGITEDILLEEAYDKIKELHKRSTPFEVSIVKADTHTPNGHLPHNCPFNSNKKLQRFQKSFKCTSHYVKKFVDQLTKQGILKNTVLIIMGDHPFMQTTLHKNYFDTKRNIYFKLITPTPVDLNRQKMTHHDMLLLFYHDKAHLLFTRSRRRN